MTLADLDPRPRLRRFMGKSTQGEAAFSAFELWPARFFYIPMILQWGLLALRYRSITLPTLANPGMQAGGLVGESKFEILSQLGREGNKWVAPYTCFSVGTASGSPSADLPQALAALETAGIEFPFVAKPDIGCRGAGVRIVRTVADLDHYLTNFPRRERIIFQRLITAKNEAGVFYIRAPGEAKGRIVSVTLKLFPEVVGDGLSTLEELIEADPRAGKIKDIYLARHGAQKDRILDKGEIFPLVFTGNHCRGAIFQDGRAQITPEMEARFDAISQGMPEFYFGRFDVRYDSLDDLRAGTNFWLIEVNGAGSEATHIWDKTTKLRDAYDFLFFQQRTLFEFGAANRARGFSSVNAFRLLGLALKQARLGRAYLESS
ncbi:MAG: D-alanine--D-alanine ligase [Rhodobacteraceae bacterium]|nr:D-alanine--D-alanine ligase [Paracoccaceae bacterium]